MARSVSGVIISRVPSGTSPRRDSPKPPTDLDGSLAASWAPAGPHSTSVIASELATIPQPRARPDRSPHMGLLLSNQLALADREIISVDQFLLGNQGLFIELIFDF